MITQEHIKECLSDAYIRSVAAVLGLNINSRILDYGVDGSFTPVELVDGQRVESGHPLDYQAKSTWNWKQEEECIVYDMEAKAWNKLARRESRATPIILILMCLPKEPCCWVNITEFCLMLKKCCYWYRVPREEVDNSSTIRVRIPRSQMLTPNALETLLNDVRRGNW